MINENEFEDNNIKIILIGSFGVGKTSIIKSFDKKNLMNMNLQHLVVILYQKLS